MSKTRYVQVRVNQNQFDRIKNNASAKGKKNVSEYARELMLDKSQCFERKFEELYQEIFAISKKLK
ncbi:hypothetical protein JXB27_01805 [Candidatus Woesearchaeota archaeon]|nr:hypothetical protein [Candidatus Woesearchaeota archaeon]